jgi:uncharacterized repeat protein (TIGR01451 family)
VLNASAFITTSQPATVAQYSMGTKVDDAEFGDPHMMLIIPTSRFFSSYLTSTSASDLEVNYLNIVAPTSAIGTVRVDGAAVPPASFTPIGTSGYSGAQVPIGLGDHTIDAAVPIGVNVYGFGGAASYGYPAGALVAPLGANLAIQKTSGTPVVPPMGQVTYTIVVSNSGPDAVTGATVTDDFPATLTNVNWTCAPSAGSTCTAAGMGDINDVVTLPSGGNITYTVTATAPAAPGAVSNTATVTPPLNANDPAPANNSSSANINVLPAAAAEAIPTASEWALMLFAAALGLAGATVIRRS